MTREELIHAVQQMPSEELAHFVQVVLREDAKRRAPGLSEQEADSTSGRSEIVDA